MLLTDSNIILEVIYRRSRAREARRLLRTVGFQLHITDFAVHSVCVHLGARRNPQYFDALRQLTSGWIEIIQLDLDEATRAVPANMHKHGLDFDDAYQYTAAEKYGLTIVSFDQHFDGTPLGRQTPEQILNATQD